MKEMELRNVKGTTDYSPKEQYIRNYISDTLKSVFEKYGFKPLNFYSFNNSSIETLKNVAKP